MSAHVATYSEDAFAFRDRPRSPRAKARRKTKSRWPLLGLCLGSSAGIAVLALPAEQPDATVADAPPVASSYPSPESAPQPLWQPLTRPAAIYGIEAADLQGLPFTFEARRDASGAREDALAFGAFADGVKPHVRVVVQRRALIDEEATAFFVELARRAAEAGLAVTRSALSEGVGTKFGAMEVADVALADAGERACLAFRFAHPEVGFRFAGWMCGAEGRPAQRRQLVCAVDRLSLVNAGSDAALKRVFAEADEQRIEGCGLPPRVAQAPKTAPPSRTVSRGRHVEGTAPQPRNRKLSRESS